MSIRKETAPSFATRIARKARSVVAGFGHPLLLGTRAIVVDDLSRVFLVRHSYIQGWHLPGGGVEVGETVLDALTRELHEEARIAMDAPPVLHGAFFNKKVENRDHVFVFIVRRFHQTGPREPDFEIVDNGFFPLDALPPDTSLSTRNRLAEAFAGAALSEYW
jgi:ADP-ribose pyrophosphatase YjhB (NUDIX family)